MNRVIGLMGAKQSGKDTIGGYLVKEHGFVRYAFADVMKDALLLLDPHVHQYSHTYRLSEIIKLVGWDRAKELYPEVRRLLQVFGTDVGREMVGPDVWVDLMKVKLRGASDRLEDVVVTDMRFPNEIRLVRDVFEGAIVRVNRPRLDRADDHASELAWRSFAPDYLVVNDRDIEHLTFQVDQVLRLEFDPAAV